MLRRRAISLLAAACGPGAARQGASLDHFVDWPGACALLAEVGTGRLLAVANPSVAGRLLLPPGSTLKPLVMAALLASGKWRAPETFFCPGRLRIAGRSLDCVHPPMPAPMRVDWALAYSCNCFVAHAAERFGPGELAAELARAGLTSASGLVGESAGAGEASGRVDRATGADDQRLQALGESGVLVTPAGLAMAYRQLARRLARPESGAVLGAVRDGMQEAVEFGTAQLAAVPGVTVAGKTGSALAENGDPVAWFAGWLPANPPKVLVCVMLHGRSGGADAAPVAARILDAYRKGKIQL
ncbi:MAG: penicillin-binding transpeptidase domain-containing protein [Bryobacteraceae bacterium]